MTALVQNTQITNTFDFWRNRTNELAYAMSTQAVTVNSNTTVGNATIQGTLTANTLVATNISLGANISIANSVSNLTITIPTTTQVNSGQYYLNANGNWTYIVSSNNTLTVTTGLAFIVDSFAMSAWNASEYLVNVKDNTANNFVTSKLIVTHDTGSAYITEYGTIVTNTAIGVFSANTDSSNVYVNFTPTSSNVTVKFARKII